MYLAAFVSLEKYANIVYQKDAVGLRSLWEALSFQCTCLVVLNRFALRSNSASALRSLLQEINREVVVCHEQNVHDKC